MSRTTFGILLALVLGARFAVAAQPPDSIPTAPALTAIDPESSAAVAIDPTQGPMQVVFFASWCRPCLADMPKLADLEDRWKADGFRMFLVAVSTRQTPERLRELHAHETLPGSVLFDADGSVAAAFGAATLPLYTLVDRRGRIVARSGALDPAFTTALERLVRQEGHGQP